MSAVSHTVQVSLFIFLVTFALVLVLETMGEDALAAFLSGNRLLAVFASALVGLVPNCSASVVITQLYLEGVLGFAPSWPACSRPPALGTSCCSAPIAIRARIP